MTSTGAAPTGPNRPRPTVLHSCHNHSTGQVRLGRIIPDRRCDPRLSGGFGIDHDVLRTSLLVIGAPGTGKTRGVGRPIVEHLALASLADRASVVVIDPKGDDYADEGWFDVTIDLLNPRVGFDLYGGAPTPHVAADQLASLLLPADVSADHQFFRNAASNRLAEALQAYHLAHDRFPPIRDLISVMRADPTTVGNLIALLKGKPNSKETIKSLKNRQGEAGSGRFDAGASAIEALSMMDRPAPRRLFEYSAARFSMTAINRPTRVRVIIGEAEYPEASRMLTNLVISQFLQVTSSPNTNRDILKVLVFDEAGDKVNQKVARAVQLLRSNNAGVVLMSQSLQDFPEDIRGTIFGSTGCKIVFGGGDPEDAALFSRYFGEHTVPIITTGHATGTGESYDTWKLTQGTRTSATDTFSLSRRDQSRWSESAIINELKAGESLAVLTTSDGQRIGPVRVNLRD